MGKKRKLHPQSIWDEQALTKMFEEHEMKLLHLNSIWRQIIRNPNLPFSELKDNVPKKLKQLLEKNFVVSTSKVVEVQHSKDGRTSKLLIRMQDGQEVETVVIRHKDTRSGGHNSVCVSSQVGCKMGCTFCATGTMGLQGQLTSGEILEQFFHAKNAVPDCTLRNVVFMGMGEPLDNWDNVREALHGLHDRRRFNLSYRHITLSTVGVVSRMKDVTDEFPDINLALSLHAPTQESRLQIVPTSKAYTVEKLVDAIDYHNKQTQNKVFIEYIVIGNVNCKPEHPHELGKLLKGKKVLINLIPYNPTDIGDEHKFVSPTDEQLENFKTVLTTEYGLFCTIRRSTTSGQDIDGACGQLALKKKNHSSRGEVLKIGAFVVCSLGAMYLLRRFLGNRTRE